MKPDILKLIHYIVWYATEKESKLTTLRLVKFLYLSDYFWAKYNQGQTITEWPWKFVHYGPFCKESLEAIEEAVVLGYIEKLSYESKFDQDYNLYIAREEPEIEEIPLPLRSELNHAISKWGDDTYGLLDYVYFETEPMIYAQKYQILDFSKVRQFETFKEIKTPQLSEDKIKKGKEIIEKIKNKHTENIRRKLKSPKPIYDDIYFQALKYLDEEDLSGEFSGQPLFFEYNEH